MTSLLFSTSFLLLMSTGFGIPAVLVAPAVQVVTFAELEFLKSLWGLGTEEE
jgi:hypothetical protein